MLMTLTLVLTYMPVIAFAGDVDADRGTPTSITYYHNGDFKISGYAEDSEYDPELDGWVEADGEYIYYPVPWFEAEDTIEVTYSNLSQPVEYVPQMQESGEGDFYISGFANKNDSNDVISPGIEWVNRQTYSNPFKENTDEPFYVFIQVSDEAGNNSILKTGDLTAHILPYTYNEGDGEDEEEEEEEDFNFGDLPDPDTIDEIPLDTMVNASVS